MDGVINCPFPKNELEIPEVDFGTILFDGIRDHTADALVDVSSGLHVSRREFLLRSERIALNLNVALDCRHGDVIAIFSPNSVEWLLVAAATLRVGAVLAGINSLLVADEIVHLLAQCRPQFIYVDNSLLSVVIDALNKLDNGARTCKIIVSGESTAEQDNCVQLNSLLIEPATAVTPKSSTAHVFQLRPKLDDPCLIMFSSGTTGLPKAVLLSHRNVVFQYLIASHWKCRYSYNHQILFAPFCHATGLFFGLFGLANGFISHLMRRFDFNTFLKTAQENKIDKLFVVPSIATMLVKSPEVHKYDLNFKVLLSAAAPLSAEVERLLRQRFSGVLIRQFYGMTECTGVCCGVPSDVNMSLRKPGTAGVALFNSQMKVLDITNGTVLGPNKAGEICIKCSPLAMMGYLNNAKATAETIDLDGWLHTGDIGYYDTDGYFFVTDRIKELIKYNAYQVAPAELEAVLLSHPDVEEAAVLGIPDRISGEVPLACVVRKAGAKVSQNELRQFVDDKVAPYKKLRGGVRFVSSLVKTASGKILRRELRKALLEGKL